MLLYNVNVFRVISRHDNILLHTVYDYFGKEHFTKCFIELEVGLDVSYAKHKSEQCIWQLLEYII